MDHAAALHDRIAGRPILSPHGHTVPAWFAEDRPFADPAELLIVPDHYVTRLLHSRGTPLADLGVGIAVEARDPRAIFRRLAEGWHLFLGTPSRMWLEETLRETFGIDTPLGPDTADVIYDRIDAALATDAFRPRALLERFDIRVLATTDAATDDLSEHAIFAATDHPTRLIPTFRPDNLLDPTMPGWRDRMDLLADQTGEDVATLKGFRAALATRRAHFRGHGATATDHGIERVLPVEMDDAAKQGVLDAAMQGEAVDGLAFHNVMLVEMAEMSVEDGLTIQIHAGSRRNTDRALFDALGPDKGADIPLAHDWVHGMDPLLKRVGRAPGLKMLLFTLDETSYARELAPMAGYWPALRLGPPWWFHDSPAGIARYFDAVVETAGYWNLAGFNDDTRALLSIPARHAMWRRAVAAHLGAQVERGRFGMPDAERIADWLVEGAAAEAYRV